MPTGRSIPLQFTSRATIACITLDAPSINRLHRIFYILDSRSVGQLQPAISNQMLAAFRGGRQTTLRQHGARCELPKALAGQAK
jgi:hypothetical protein